MASDPSGFTFPFRFAAGGVARQEGDAKLKENIIHILLTTVGERVMRRDYGGSLRQILHDPNNDALRSIVQHQVAKAIAAQEPRVTLRDLTVTQEEATLTITVHYTVRRTRQTHQLSLPIGLGEL